VEQCTACKEACCEQTTSKGAPCKSQSGSAKVAPTVGAKKNTICASRNWILLPKAELSKIFLLHDDPSNTPADNAQSWTKLLGRCPSTSHFRIPSGCCSAIDQVMSAINHNQSQWFWTFLVLVILLVPYSL
jgi:hypothetical protein